MMSSALFFLVPTVLLLLEKKRGGVSQVISGGHFIDSLPSGHGPQREKMILDEIVRKQDQNDWNTSDVTWTDVIQQHGEKTVSLPVMTDALKLDGVRINTTFDTAQKIADVLGVYLLTPHVSDLINDQSGIAILPSANPNWMSDGTGSKTARMIGHSRQVDEKIQNAKPIMGKNPDLVNNPGKYWVNTQRNWEKPGYGANYGWYLKSAPGGIIQGPIPGLKHNIQHVDYSQVFRAMGPMVTFTTPTETYQVPTEGVLASPELRYLIAGTDKLPQLRHPGIAPYIPMA